MSKSVLVVDDEHSIRNLLVEFLQIGGYETFEACNGQEGLRQVFDNQPDLIVTDMRMPVMDGYEFSNHARSISKAPIIMITGITNAREKMAILTPAVDVYLEKPVTLGNFLDRVFGLLSMDRQPTKSIE